MSDEAELFREHGEDESEHSFRRFSAWAIAMSFIAVICWPTGALSATAGFLEFGGVKLFYEVAGAGPAMVFLHDGHMHSESWDAQWEFFSRTHRVVRYDRRGYGKSAPPTAAYSNVEDLRAVLAHLSVTNAVLVGASAGGRLAIDFTLAHPELVKRLVLAGPVVSGLDFSAHFDRRVSDGFRPLRERNDIGATVTNWMNDRWLIHSTNRAAKERFRQLLTANPQNWTRASAFSKSARPAIPRLGEIRAPTLILVGESDMPDVHAHGGAIQAGIPNAQRVVVPGAAHCLNLELPGEFNQLVAQFLAGSGKPKDLVYYVPEMEHAVARCNHVYKQADNAPLEADVYLPANVTSDARLPAIVFVVGDAGPETLRHAKDWTSMQSYGRLAASHGFAGITFNHRSSESQSRLPEVRSDIDDLIRWVCTNATGLNVDSQKLCLWFFSGSGVHFESGFGTNANFIRCMVGYYPVLAPSSRTEISVETRRAFSAAKQLKRHAPRVPPLLIARAGRDSQSLNQRIDEFRLEAKRHSAPLLILEHPDGEHAFDIRNDDEKSREIIRHTFAFIKQQFAR